jgi:hypothetical protein
VHPKPIGPIEPTFQP